MIYKTPYGITTIISYNTTHNRGLSAVPLDYTISDIGWNKAE